MLADVALVGFPSAGKSSLVAAMSAARPKIADYPFTTLVPNLGVVQAGDQTFTVADVPGLIPGAATGKGLGMQFLRHIERTSVLVHVLDAATRVTIGVMVWGEVVADFDAIELAVHQPSGNWTPISLTDAGFEAPADAGHVGQSRRPAGCPGAGFPGLPGLLSPMPGGVCAPRVTWPPASTFLNGPSSFLLSRLALMRNGTSISPISTATIAAPMPTLVHSSASMGTVMKTPQAQPPATDVPESEPYQLTVAR